MADRYADFVHTTIGKAIVRQVGLPAPAVLERYRANQPVIDGPVLLGAAPGAKLDVWIATMLAHMGAQVHSPDAATGDQTYKALIFDASGIESSQELIALWEFFHPTIRRVQASGRVIVVGVAPELAASPQARIAQRSLEGFTRSVGKEVRHGGAVNLLYVDPGAENQLESTLRFLLSPRSAYVSGQVIAIGPSDRYAEVDWNAPLAHRTALVTGAARGIGRAIAEVLARDGAHVVALDVPQAAEALATVAADIGGSELAVDITADDAPQLIADHLSQYHGGVDVVVHNAGVTRDKTLGRMSDVQWNLVLAVNTTAIERIDAELVARDVVRPNGRMILVSSIAGIAGNVGQTNYATSKAAVIGIVEAYADAAAERGLTINAVAPGFIETEMTAAIPLATREAGRRLNSMSQGGLPVDVAETVAWFASPASAGVNGNIVRVCGQSLIGA